MLKYSAHLIGVLSACLFLAQDASAISFTLSDHFIAGSSTDGRVAKLWDARTGVVAYRGLPETDLGTLVASDLSGDGRFLFLERFNSSGQGAVEVLDANSQKRVAEFPLALPPNSGSLIDPSRDGSRFIIWGRYGKTITLFGLGEGHALSEIKDCQSVNLAKLSPDGTQVLALCAESVPGGSRTFLKLFDALTGKVTQVLKGPESAMLAFLIEISFSEGGRFALLNSTYYHGIWDARTGKPFAISAPGLSETGDISVSRDETTVVFQGDESKVIDVGSGKVLQSIPQRCVQSVLSPDKTTLYCASYHGVSEWDLISGKVRRWLSEDTSSDDYLLELSRDGDLLARTDLPPSGEKSRGTLVWDTRTGNLKFGLQAASPDGRAEISVDSSGKKFAWLASRYLVEIRDLETGALQSQIAFPHYAESARLRLSPGGDRVFVPHSTSLGVIYDSQTGAALVSSENMGWDHPYNVTACFSPDGKTALMGSYPAFVGETHPGRLVSLESGQIRGSVGTGVQGCMFLDQDTVLIDNSIALGEFEIWSLSSGAKISSQKGSRFPTFYLNSGLWVNSPDRGTDVRDLRTGELKIKLPDGHSLLNLSANGELLAARTDQSLELWSVSEKSVIASAKIYSSSPTRAAFSPDGKRVAVVGVTGFVGESCVDSEFGEIFEIGPDRMESISRSSWKASACFFFETFADNASYVPGQPYQFIGSSSRYLNMMDLSSSPSVLRWKADIDLGGDGR